MNSLADVVAGRARWIVIPGDCRRVLKSMPPASVDHVIADAPYSQHVHGKQRRVASGGEAREAELGFESLNPVVRHDVATETARICRRWALFFSDVESAHYWERDLVLSNVGMRHVRVGAWVKLGCQPQLNGKCPAAGFEAIEIAHSHAGAGEAMAWNGGGHPGVWFHPIATARNGGRRHPTEKPLSLMRELVEDFTQPGDLVVDPFCGSGTTGVACLLTGRRFIGCELSPEWANTAALRLEQTEADLFDVIGLSNYRKPRQAALELVGGAS